MEAAIGTLGAAVAVVFTAAAGLAAWGRIRRASAFRRLERSEWRRTIRKFDSLDRPAS